jgi:hypothetical protein
MLVIFHRVGISENNILDAVSIEISCGQLKRALIRDWNGIWRLKRDAGGGCAQRCFGHVELAHELLLDGNA